MAKNVDEKITIYLWAQSGSEDAQIKEFLSRYSELNPNIIIDYVDPAYNPTFISQYIGADGKEPSSNSLVVVSDKRFKVVDYYNIYQYDYDQDTLYNIIWHTARTTCLI
jgi:ABC-2 type transport system permease protein